MKSSYRVLVLTLSVLFLVSLIAGCSMTDLSKAGNLKLGKYAETKTVKKDSISKSIKTQWGKFKFSSKQISKIKKLKNVSKMKKKSDIKKNTYTCKKTIGKKTIAIAVTYVGGGKYQLAMGGI